MRKQIFAFPGAGLKRVSLTIVLAGALSALAATGRAAAIKIMSDSPLAPALTKVAGLYRQETHDQVSLTFDPPPAVQ